MTDLAAPSQPRNIPGATSSLSAASALTISSPARSQRPAVQTVDTLSPVTQNGSFEFDRIVKEGEVLKRTRKTKSWKTIYMVLRPNLLSIYRDKTEARLRHQVNLSDLTAVTRQKDPKHREKPIFGLFSPSRNFHLQASTDADAQDWVEQIRHEARIDWHREEEELYLASPSGPRSPYAGFGRSIDEQIHSPGADDHAARHYSSSDIDMPLSANLTLPRHRSGPPRQPSYIEYSGPDRGSFSDGSDGMVHSIARMSALSLAQASPDVGRPSTSSAYHPYLSPGGASASGVARPSMSGRSISQMSGFGGLSVEDSRRAQHSEDEERVVYQGWIYLLKSKSGVRQWKKVWLVLRPRALALYKDEAEYAATLVLPLKDVIDAVEIDPISRTRTTCMQIISDERNYRFCALDEEQLANCLGAIKSLLARRKARLKELESSAAVPPVAVSPP